MILEALILAHPICAKKSKMGCLQITFAQAQRGDGVFCASFFGLNFTTRRGEGAKNVENMKT